MAGSLSLVTWNVNSIRSRLDLVLEYVDEVQPDVLCLQETKVSDAQFPRVPFMEYGYHVTHHGDGGYAGVAILSKQAPESPQRGFCSGQPDLACRVVAASVAGLRIYGLYCPNGTALGSERFAHKLAWFRRVRAEITPILAAGTPLILAGDFNIAPDVRDVWDARAMTGQLHYTDEEHATLAELLGDELADCFRKHERAPGHYTWWDYRGGAYARGQGLRIDHVYASPAPYGACTAVFHDAHTRAWEGASDHAPVRACFAWPDS